MKEIVFTSVSQLINETASMKPQEWMFRGHTDETYKLLPTIGRTRKDPEKHPFDAEQERWLLQRFQDQTRPHLQLNLLNNLEWLVFGQHHGLPTRVLDWSRSPLVAAFFACENIEPRINWSDPKRPTVQPEVHGAVLAALQPQIVTNKEMRNPFNAKEVGLVVPAHVTRRITQQSGLLTLHGKPDSAWQPAELQKFVIPRRCKFGIKKELARLGLHRASLYPDVDGIALFLKWQFKWNEVL